MLTYLELLEVVSKENIKTFISHRNVYYERN